MRNFICSILEGSVFALFVLEVVIHNLRYMPLFFIIGGFLIVIAFRTCLKAPLPPLSESFGRIFKFMAAATGGACLGATIVTVLMIKVFHVF